MSARSTALARTIAAEARAVEEGHRAWVQADGSVKVVSDSRPAKWYRVTFQGLAVGEPIRFTCEPQGAGCYDGDHLLAKGDPGRLPCKHAALAARRLEREGLAAMDGAGAWVVTERAHELTAAKLADRQPADPFEGLT